MSEEATIKSFAEGVKKFKKIKGEEEPPKNRKASVTRIVNTGGSTRYGLRAAEGECDRLSSLASGTRNQELFKAACNLGELVAGGELTEADAYDHLIRGSTANGYISDDGRTSADKSIRSGFRKGAQSPRRASQEFEWRKYEPFLPDPEIPEDDESEDSEEIRIGLPPEFWQARPVLTYIRDKAWSRIQSAEGLLGAVLARVAAGCDHRVKLPPIIGAPCGLSLLVALSAKSGGGKSVCSGIAKEIVPPRNIPPDCDGVPPGSGEGLIELLYGVETEVDPVTGKQHEVRRQVHHNAYIYIDEGVILSQLASRSSGSVFWSVLRSVFTDQTIGQSNASQDRRRVVAAGRYVYGLVMAIQPQKTAALFGESAEGTPQRLLWIPIKTYRPGRTERPEEPLSYPWPEVRFKPDALFGDRMYIEVDQQIKNDIIDRYHERMSQPDNPEDEDELDSHEDLLCLKVASILAILDGRTNVSKRERKSQPLGDWDLAQMILEMSRATRDASWNYQKSARQKLNRERGVDRAEVELGRTEWNLEEYEKLLIVAKDRIVKTVRAHAEKHPEGCKTECVRTSLAGKERVRAKKLADELGTDWRADAVRRAVLEDLIDEENGKFRTVRNA